MESQPSRKTKTGKSSALAMRHAAIADPATTAQQLLALATAEKNIDLDVLTAVGAHSNCPGDIMTMLVEKYPFSESVMVAVAANPHIPPQLLAQLVHHGQTKVRNAAINNPQYVQNVRED